MTQVLGLLIGRRGSFAARPRWRVLATKAVSYLSQSSLAANPEHALVRSPQ